MTQARVDQKERDERMDEGKEEQEKQKQIGGHRDIGH